TGLTGFPVGVTRVPAATPNLGAVQAPAAYPPSLASTFNKAPLGAPAGWRTKGEVKIAPDPAGFTGNALVFGPDSAATRTFPVGAGFLRVSARLRTTDPAKRVLFEVADAAGVPVAAVGVRDGRLIYTDGADVRMLPYPVPANTWTRVGMLLRPETGTYDVLIGGTAVTTAGLRSDARVAERLVAGADKEAGLALDDVLVLPEPCPGPEVAPDARMKPVVAASSADRS
ncbi:hypothetical protein, partial [Actinocorallia lasiicapitis]